MKPLEKGREYWCDIAQQGCIGDGGEPDPGKKTGKMSPKKKTSQDNMKPVFIA